MIQLKRVYEAPAARDGARFLVERLWPRGVRKTDAPLNGWLKEAGPSNELRKWFSHDPEKWTEFQHRYFGELDTRPQAWEPILKAARHGSVTLLYSFRDADHDNALALKTFLDAKLSRRSAEVHKKGMSGVR